MTRNQDRLMLSEHQTKALTLLLDCYENSKTYQGTAKVHQHFTVSAAKVYPEYADLFLSVPRREAFESDMHALEDQGVVELHWDGVVLLTIQAREDAWEEIRRLLNRRDANAIRDEQLAFYDTAGTTPVSQCFCKEEAERLRNGRKARYDLEKAKNLVGLLDVIVQNAQFMLERELSMQFFRDSKTFEKSYRKTIVNLLLQYGDRVYPLEDMEDPGNEREKQMLVLSEHGIESNPSYIFMKGDLIVHFQDGSVMQFFRTAPSALVSDALERVSMVEVHGRFVMTVENLTAYHRLMPQDGVILFLSGYHKRGMERFLKCIGQNQPELTWYHFGDLDPYGLDIFEHLKEQTGLPFKPWHMGTQELEKFEGYAKPLEDFDFSKMEMLKAYPEWAEVIAWMQEHGKKLEQEWVAWNLYNVSEGEEA